MGKQLVKQDINFMEYPLWFQDKYFADKQKLSLKACYIENEYFDGDQLKALATLPSKNDLIAGIIGSLDSPISGIVGSINAVIRDLVSVVDEISKKKAA